MDRQFPIGKFARPAQVSAAELTEWVGDIERFPRDLRAAVSALGSGGLDRPYREGGWTGRQVVHHLADSHINSYVRMRLALTEDNPSVKPYDEAAWALLADAAEGPVETSLALVDNLHARWTALLRSLRPDQWSRTLTHQQSGVWRMDQHVGLYSWHGRHHIAHLKLI